MVSLGNKSADSSIACLALSWITGETNLNPSRKERLGECDKETSFNILDTFYENGGNFIDT
jgi:aryl-alcohol dehydrogenase-like predicted oxidoreductase